MSSESEVQELSKSSIDYQSLLQSGMSWHHSVLATTPDLAYIFDLNYRFLYANEGLLKMWGKSWDEAIGKNCLELGYEPWHAEMHSREIDQVVRTKQPVRGVVPFTGTFGRRIYDYILTPVMDARGEVRAVAGITRDVTESKQVEEALRESEAKLARELIDMTRLHELSLQLAQQEDLNEVMREVMEAAGELLGAHSCTAQLLNPQDQSLRLVASKGLDAAFREQFAVVTRDGFTTCAAALARHSRVIVGVTVGVFVGAGVGVIVAVGVGVPKSELVTTNSPSVTAAAFFPSADNAIEVQ